MPLPIDVKPYALNGVIIGDNYLTHYKGINDSGEDVVITEFFPMYMVKREDDGTLDISERFSKEFTADRDEFLRRAEGFKEVRDASLHPVVEVFERNCTAYMVRRACGLTTVEQFMGHQTMDFDEAYYFIRPLILSMSRVAEKGMFFNISPQDFRVNSFKQIVLFSHPAWDTSFHPTLTQLMRLYYRLVTGMDAPEQDAPPFSAYGIEVPPRIEAFVMEIIGGDILYGSLDDFFKKFKSLIENTVDTDQSSGKKSLAVMRGVAAALFVLFALSLTLLVYGAVLNHQRNTYWASPEIFADGEAPPPPPNDFSAVTLTHPRNPADALPGSFAEYDGFLFFRGEEGLKSRLFADVLFVPGAMGMSALADDRLIVPGALPSSIVGHTTGGGARLIYFSDAAQGNVIYRVTTAGNDLTRVTEYPALNLTAIGNTLYYSDVNRGFSLWSRTFGDNFSTQRLTRPVYEMISSGTHLFFLAGADEENVAALYSWDTSEGGQLIRVSTDAAGGLRVFGSTLYYINTSGRVQSVTFEGRRLATHTPENVRTYDVFFQWLIFAEEGVNIPRAYNMHTGRFFTLSNTEWVSYIWVLDAQIYAIDNRDPRMIHVFNFP